MKIVRIADVGVEAAAEEAASLLVRGGIVLFPTDTLYGLAVDARDSDAVRRLIVRKGRDAGKAISVIRPDIKAIETYAEVSETARGLIQKHLPGPLTLVLPIQGNELQHLASDGTIGIRVPDDAFTRSLADVFYAPYTATSANISGQETLHDVSEILEQFGASAQSIDLVIDDGPRAGGQASSVVRIVGDKIEILRESALRASDLGL